MLRPVSTPGLEYALSGFSCSHPYSALPAICSGKVEEVMKKLAKKQEGSWGIAEVQPCGMECVTCITIPLDKPLCPSHDPPTFMREQAYFLSNSLCSTKESCVVFHLSF